MAYILYFGAIFINLVYVMLNKKNNFVAFLTAIAVLLVMANANTNSVGSDLHTYNLLYITNDFSRSNQEAGYVFINNVFYNLGFNFEQFRLVVFAFCFLLIFFTLKDYIKNYHLVIAFFTITLCNFFWVAIRFFIGFSIVVFGLKFLFKKNWLGAIIFAILVYVASLFHQSMIFAYVFFLCIIPSNKTSWVKVVLICLSVLSLLLSALMVVRTELIEGVSTFLNKITAGFFLEDRNLANTYFDNRYSRQYVIYIIFFVLNFVALLFAKSELNEIGGKEKELYSMVYTMGLIFMPFSFTLILSQTMMRLMFFFLFLSLICFTMVLEKKKGSELYVQVGEKSVSLPIFKTIVLVVFFTWFLKIYVMGDLGFNLLGSLSRSLLN